MTYEEIGEDDWELDPKKACKLEDSDCEACQ